MILVVARPFDLERAVVEVKARFGIEPQRPEADPKRPLVDRLSRADQPRTQRVERRRLDRPQPGSRDRESKRNVGRLKRRHRPARGLRRDHAPVGVDQRRLDRDGGRVLADIAERRGHRDGPRAVGSAARIGVDTVGGDISGIALHQPDVAVQPRALVPPAFHRLRIDAHDDRVQVVAIAREIGDIDVHRIIAAPVVRDDRSVEPDRRVRRDPAELDFEIAPAVLRIEPQRAPIPAETAAAIALRHVGAFGDGHRHRPVVRQRDLGPVRIVII